MSFIFYFIPFFLCYKNSLEATLDYITFIIQQYAAILLHIDVLNGKCLYTSLQLPSVFINHNFNFSLSTLLYKLLQHKLFPWIYSTYEKEWKKIYQKDKTYAFPNIMCRECYVHVRHTFTCNMCYVYIPCI